MTRHRIAWFALCLLSADLAGAESKAELRNTDVIMVFEADANAPRLLTLQPSSHATWSNRAPEFLIDYAERGGERVALHWRLDEKGSVTESRHVVFVYACESPRLRLTWEWISRAAYGPVEHYVRIENLDKTELWLPLQDSFRFDWQVARQSSLKQLYIEKGAG